MKTKLSFLFLFTFLFYLSSAQIPQGFNYQAVAHTSTGAAIQNTTLQVKASILSDTLTPVIVWEELHSTVKTNASGVFGLVIGTGNKESGTASAFNSIDWSKTPLYLKIQIYYQNAWKYMGTSRLWSVPFAMTSGNATDVTGIQAEIDAIETGTGLNTNGAYTANASSNYLSAATSLKIADGLLDTKVKTNEGNITANLSEINAIETGAGLNTNGSYSTNSLAKYISTATSLRDADNKLDAQLKINSEYIAANINGSVSKLKISGMETSPDSALFRVVNKSGQTVFAVYNEGVRIYVDDGSVKGAKGGFSVGGFGSEKGISQPLLVVNTDSIRAYVYDDPLTKTPKGGFSVGGYDAAKGVTNKYLMVSPDSVRIYIDKAPSTKSPKGGFSIGGFDQAKGLDEEYFRVTRDSTRVYVNEASAKGAKGGFSIGGFGDKKGTSENFLKLTPDNYFIGHNSGKNITTGLYNSFLGYMSGFNNTEGTANTFFGDSTGLSNTTGSWNVFLGKNAGYSNETSVSNVYIGDGAGELAKHSSTSSGSYNVAVGTLAGYQNTGRYNVFLGQEAGYYNLNGKQNVFIGLGAGYENDTANYNIAIGTYAGYKNMGDANVFMGNFAGYANTEASYNLFIGSNAGQATTTGDKNVILGSDAGYDNTTGRRNVFIGNLSGKSNTTGEHNVFAGSQSGYANLIGSYNTVMGNDAGYDVIGSYNTLIGNAAGQSATSDYNTMVGHQAGINTTSGSRNAFFGHQAGHDNISGEYNTIIGPNAGHMNTAGSDNTIIGVEAGYYNTGSNNVFIGRWAGSNETGSDKLYIENDENSSDAALIYGDFAGNLLRFNAWVGINAIPSSTYRLYVTGSAYSTVGWYYPSDIRLKQNVSSMDNDGVVDKVRDIGVIRYNYKDEVASNEENPKTKYIGVIAQDIEESFPEAVSTDEKGFKAVSLNALTSILLQAVKDQQKQIDTLKKEIEELKGMK